MEHKKAMILQPQGMKTQGSTDIQQTFNHSESNPILNAPVVTNDRVKLQALNHIPSVKSNLMSQGNDSATDLNANARDLTKGASFINYENMPIGKKSILAPLSNVSPMIGGGK